MRISDWSSDVCSSDLVSPGYWHGTACGSKPSASATCSSAATSFSVSPPATSAQLPEAAQRTWSFKPSVPHIPGILPWYIASRAAGSFHSLAISLRYLSWFDRQSATWTNLSGCRSCTSQVNPPSSMAAMIPAIPVVAPCAATCAVSGAVSCTVSWTTGWSVALQAATSANAPARSEENTYDLQSL